MIIKPATTRVLAVPTMMMLCYGLARLERAQRAEEDLLTGPVRVAHHRDRGAARPVLPEHGQHHVQPRLVGLARGQAHGEHEARFGGRAEDLGLGHRPGGVLARRDDRVLPPSGAPSTAEAASGAVMPGTSTTSGLSPARLSTRPATSCMPGSAGNVMATA